MTRGGAKRRTTQDLSPVRRTYIQGLINKVDEMNYGYSIRGGLSPQEQRMRNKALISLLYLSGRRISEIVGRIYEYEDGSTDVWEGLTVEDFRMGKVEDEAILRVRFRVLKRGKAEDGLKTIMAFIDLRLDDSLSQYIVDWLKKLEPNHKGKVFAISRSRAWQIIHKLDSDIWVHWFRHQRLTHLSDAMDPYELKEFAKFARLDTALEYVHKAPTKILAKTKEADELWR